MDAPGNQDWIALHEFDDPSLARDVVTVILSMEFDVVLLDLSDGRVVAGGVDSENDGAEDPERPVVLGTHIGGLVSRMDPTQISQADPEAQEQFEAGRQPLEGGPWRLLVPPDSHAELESVLPTIIEEQVEFDVQHEETRRTELRFTRYMFLGLFLLFLLFVLLRIIGVF